MKEDVTNLLLRHASAAMIDAAARDLAVRAMARVMNIDITREELQAAADEYRIERDLLSYDDTRRWLSDNWLSEAGWREQLRFLACTQRLLQSESIASLIDETFAARSEDYRRALVARLIVEEEGLAHELFLLNAEENYNFDVIVRRYSIEPVGVPPHMTRRRYFRFELPAAVASVFDTSASLPIVLRPIEIDGAWHVYKLYDVYPPELDEETRTAVSRRLFEARLAPFLDDARRDLRTQFGMAPGEGG